MPNAKLHRHRHLDPRAPLVFDLRALGPGSARSEARTVPAPADLGSGLVRVPAGSDLAIEARFEEVTEGVLVTASAGAVLAGECARCLAEFTSAISVGFRELFSADAGEEDGDRYRLDGDLLDLEPALRDALVLELPLSPLCSADCPGLCGRCGIRLADAGPGHRHREDGGAWAALAGLFPAGAAPGADAGAARRHRNSSRAGTGPAGTKEP